MRAIIHRRYGPPSLLEFGDAEKPIPKPNEVLVRVHASSINPADLYVVTGVPFVVRLAFGLLKPRHKSPGRDFAGKVESIGTAVTLRKPGDEVYGECEQNGAFAEYICVPETGAGLRPANVSFEQAAAIPLAATTALQGLRNIGKIQAGHKVLINGASGGVGTFAVQIAKAFGAGVTAVCSAKNGDLVRSLGADHISDYNAEDFTRAGKRYDLVFDLVGSRPLSDCLRVLSPQGLYVSAVGRLGWLFKVALRSMVDRRFAIVNAKQTLRDLKTLRELVESGEVRPIIGKSYLLGEVPDALDQQFKGHAQGKTVIRLIGSGDRI